jgi:hypothetical protein
MEILKIPAHAVPQEFRRLAGKSGDLFRVVLRAQLLPRWRLTTTYPPGGPGIASCLPTIHQLACIVITKAFLLVNPQGGQLPHLH